MTLNMDLDYLDALMNKGKRSPKCKFEYLKDGTQVYRILPSFDPADRRMEHTYAVHWLTGENGKPMKALCTYFTERFCPLCAAHRETKTAYEHSLATNGPEASNTKHLAQSLQKLSSSKTIYYNAVNMAGEPVVLELNSTVSKALEALIIEAATKKGFDPLALKGGVWFTFTKTGKGRDSVRVDYRRTMKVVEGDMAEILDRTPFSDELIARLPQAVANIHDPKTLWIREYTSAQLGDYLKGKPLPNPFKRAEGSSITQVATQEAGSSVETSQQISSGTTQEAPKSVTPVATPQAAPGVDFGKYAAEAERLKRLAALTGGSN